MNALRITFKLSQLDFIHMLNLSHIYERMTIQVKVDNDKLIQVEG